MARDPASVRADRLIEQAQAGQAAEVLRLIEQDLAEAGAASHPATFFAQAVAHDVLGQHQESATAAELGVTAARRGGREGWRAACLAMRALQLIQAGDRDPVSFDESQVMRDLAQAQVALAADAGDAGERLAAYVNLAMAYTRLRLYELAAPMYLAGAAEDPELPGEARAVQQLNLADLHLTWAVELHHVGALEEAADHGRQALEHAEQAGRAAAGPYREVWVERARLFAGCARSFGPDPLGAARQVQRSLAELEPVGADYERAVSAPLVGLALAAAGRTAEGLEVVEAALAVTGPSADPVVLAGIQHARLVLLASGSEGARAGLELARTLSAALWRQRARRLSTAEALLRYERLQAEHLRVARDSELDPLTGAGSRRVLDQRLAQLGRQQAEEGTSGCVLVIDVDRLKLINDTSGHQAGDRVLRSVGSALRGSVREQDLLARFGGDEFVAVLQADLVEGRLVAERMLRAVRQLEWPDPVHRPTVSIGVALAGREVTPEQALAAADQAMYAAKRAGGDAVVVADPPPTG